MKLSFSYKGIATAFDKATSACSISNIINKLDAIKQINAQLEETNACVSDLQARTELNRTTGVDNSAAIAELKAEVTALKNGFNAVLDTLATAAQ